MDLLKRIDAAFEDVPTPARVDILARPLAEASEDEGALAVEFAGIHWTQLPVLTYFYHREMLSLLGPVGYRAYVAAYLRGSLIGEYADDVSHYLLCSLRPSLNLNEERSVRARLSLLNREQRHVIAAVVHHLINTKGRLAEEVLDYFRASNFLDQSPSTF